MAKDERRWVDGEHQDDGVETSGMSPKQIAAAVIGVLLVIFVLQNTDSTPITLLIFDVSFPLWLVLLGTILLSTGIGYLLGSRRRRG